MIISEEWNKATVREALDVLEKVYKFNRKNIRFKVR